MLRVFKASADAMFIKGNDIIIVYNYITTDKHKIPFHT